MKKFGRDCPAPKHLWKLAWMPAFAGMTVFCDACVIHPTTVIPTKVGTHASFSECNRHRESKALTEQEPIFFFTGLEVGIQVTEPR